MNKILILGGAGFIGYHLSLELSLNKNNKIVIIDNFKRGVEDFHFKELLRKPNVEFKKMDLLNVNTIKIGTNLPYILICSNYRSKACNKKSA